MKKSDRAKLIEEAVRMVYDSLESHLPWTHRISSEGEKFHKKCVKEYVRIIEVLAQLY